MTRIKGAFMQTLRLQDLTKSLPILDSTPIQSLLQKELDKIPGKIVVLDDDPTGVQTVHDIYVYTDCTISSIREGFAQPGRLFYLLTNSRGLTEEETTTLHRQIALDLATVSRETHTPFQVILRGDSTLRGHYPLEPLLMKETLEDALSFRFDGEILCPFFLEGGRYTAGDVHYVEDRGQLIPAGETEFAKDKTFGYHASDLKDYIEEKTAGNVKAENVASISLEMLRNEDYLLIYNILMGLHDYGHVVVNALDYSDLEVFAIAFYRAVAQGKRFLIRSSASLVRVLGGISPRPLLTAKDLGVSGRGGLIVAGSHTKKTTAQLEELLTLPHIRRVLFNQHLVLEEDAFLAEIDRVVAEADRLIAEGSTVVIMTRRERIDAGTGNPEDDLVIAVKISSAITQIVSLLTHKPAYVIAKGGITSSDIGTKALKVHRALVMGQILPGIPVWQTGAESRFPDLPYIIFPGNVGEADSLRIIVEKLSDLRKEDSSCPKKS